MRTLVSILPDVPGFRRTNNRRVLGYLLLVIIAYGATVDLVHSHGHVSQIPTNFNAVSDAGGSHSSHSGYSSGIECPMCQFQQELFNGLVQSPHSTPASSGLLPVVSTLTIFCPSTSTTPRY